MRTLLAVLGILLITACTNPNPAKATECSRLEISSVAVSTALNTFHQIEDCVNKEAETIVYVYGSGGSVPDSLAFFDLMRSHSNVCDKTTFVVLGRIASASNITLLAGCNRAAYEHASFHIHGSTLNMSGEDYRVRDSAAKFGFSATYEAVKLAAGEAAAQFWLDILSGNEQGIVLSAEEALKLGWIDRIISVGE